MIKLEEPRARIERTPARIIALEIGRRAGGEAPDDSRGVHCPRSAGRAALVSWAPARRYGADDEGLLNAG